MYAINPNASYAKTVIRRTQLLVVSTATKILSQISWKGEQNVENWAFNIVISL